MRIEEAFKAEGFSPDAASIGVTCAACGLTQSFADTPSCDGADGRTEYFCSRAECGAVVAIVAPSGLLKMPFSIGDVEVQILGDMRLPERD